MNSPFPGMDPYLERFWGDVHTRYLVYACDQINEQLPADLCAAVEEGDAVDTADESHRVVYPDIQVVEEPAATAYAAPADTAIPVAQPRVVAIVSEQPTRRHIKIVDVPGGGRVVTAIELLSPWNKVAAEGRELYKKKQRDYLCGRVNLVEIDFVRAGRLIVAVPDFVVPDDCRTPFLVCIRRVDQPLLAELYPITLRESLPNIRVPLRPADQPIVLQLQPLMGQCYHSGRYATRIDYRKPPRPALSEEDERWADGLLREKGLRTT